MNIDEQLKSARKHADSPADLQATLMEILITQQVNFHSQLADALAHDEMFQNVKAFHEKFGLPYDGGPRSLDPEMQLFRISTMHEELKEYEDAVAAGDLEGQFDALIDLAYFVFGTAHLSGFPFRQGWKRVHEANMRKVRASADAPGKRGSKLDVTKPKGWVPPTLTDLVQPQK